jgi:LPS O-antigen subunit length determinant protein (WzzB/FepE family)
MLMLASLLVVFGCEQRPADQTPETVTSEDVRREANQAAKTAVEFSQQTKEEFQKKLEAQLKQSDADIARLREKGSELQDEAKANWERKMADLETKRDAARVKLGEVGAASAEARLMRSTA